AIASPGFARQYFNDGMQAAALARAPMLVFNRKDELQWRFVRRLTRARLQPPLHYLPSSTGFVEAAACGLGWGMAPETLVAPAVRAGRVVVLEPRRWLDVPLYWQHAAVRSSTLQHITQALRTAASGTLR
ncbi:chromosome replication initiation inhibitor protein, partial [Stenotrophomonas sp. DDT-1]